MDLQSLYGERDDPRAVLIVNPGNPAGNFLKEKELAELCMLAKTRGSVLISDEVFFDFTPSEAPAAERVSAASQSTVLTFTLSGISKTLGLPQMKLSWIVVTGPDEARREACRRLEIIADTFLSANTPAQNALEAWFAKEHEIQSEINARLRTNLAAARQVLGSKGAVRLHEPAGGWSAVLEVHNDKHDEELALQLLRKDQVLVHPGFLFDFDQGVFLVISLLAPPDIFKEGVRRIAARFK